MSETAITIRMAEEGDAEALLAIYAPYVEKTAITFEYKVPTVREFKNRIASTLKRYPYLAAVRDGRILGYAYASEFKERAAYDWAVETSVYVSEDARRTGAGSILYKALENYLKRQNVINVNACIAYPNPGSIAFHEKHGYRIVGHFTKCGYKLGQWWDMVWMEKCWGPPGTAGTFYTGRQTLEPGLKIPVLRYALSRPYIPASRLHRFTVSSFKSSPLILHRQFFPRVDGSLILADVPNPR